MARPSHIVVLTGFFSPRLKDQHRIMEPKITKEVVVDVLANAFIEISPRTQTGFTAALGILLSHSPRLLLSLSARQSFLDRLFELLHSNSAHLQLNILRILSMLLASGSPCRKYLLNEDVLGRLRSTPVNSVLVEEMIKNIVMYCV